MLTRLSPTALNWFESDIDRFVLYYVLGAQRLRQTRPMAIGSAFDARVKGSLTADLLGVPNNWEELYERQVEPQHKASMIDLSLELLHQYKQTGAYKHITELASSASSIRFEFSGERHLTIDDLTVPLYGKPDCEIVLPQCRLILDWKVNGYDSATSPASGYISLRTPDGFNSGPHKNTQTYLKNALEVSLVSIMKDDWATQLGFYQLILSDHLPTTVMIDQLTFLRHTLRVATHRVILQNKLLDSIKQRAYRCWKAFSSGHYYTELSKDESDKKVQALRDMDDMKLFATIER